MESSLKLSWDSKIASLEQRSKNNNYKDGIEVNISLKGLEELGLESIEDIFYGFRDSETDEQWKAKQLEVNNEELTGYCQDNET